MSLWFTVNLAFWTSTTLNTQAYRLGRLEGHRPTDSLGTLEKDLLKASRLAKSHRLDGRTEDDQNYIVKCIETMQTMGQYSRGRWVRFSPVEKGKKKMAMIGASPNADEAKAFYNWYSLHDGCSAILKFKDWYSIEFVMSSSWRLGETLEQKITSIAQQFDAIVISYHGSTDGVLDLREYGRFKHKEGVQKTSQEKLNMEYNLAKLYFNVARSVKPNGRIIMDSCFGRDFATRAQYSLTTTQEHLSARIEGKNIKANDREPTLNHEGKVPTVEIFGTSVVARSHFLKDNFVMNTRTGNVELRQKNHRGAQWHDLRHYARVRIPWVPRTTRFSEWWSGKQRNSFGLQSADLGWTDAEGSRWKWDDVQGTPKKL